MRMKNKKNLIEKVGQTSWENGCYAGLVHESWYHQYDSELALNPIFRVKHNNYTHIQQWSTIHAVSERNCSPTCYSSLSRLLRRALRRVHGSQTKTGEKFISQNLFSLCVRTQWAVDSRFFFGRLLAFRPTCLNIKWPAGNFSLKRWLKVKSWTLKHFDSNARPFNPYYLYTMKRKFMTVSFATISFV